MREVFGVRENRTSRRSAEQNRRRVPSTPRLALSLFAVSIPAWCVSGCVCLPPHLPATMPPHPLPQSLSFSAPTLSLAPFLSLRTPNCHTPSSSTPTPLTPRALPIFPRPHPPPFSNPQRGARPVPGGGPARPVAARLGPAALLVAQGTPPI